MEKAQKQEKPLDIVVPDGVKAGLLTLQQTYQRKMQGINERAEQERSMLIASHNENLDICIRTMIEMANNAETVYDTKRFCDELADKQVTRIYQIKENKNV